MSRALFRFAAALYMLLFLGFIIAPLLFVVVNSFNQAKYSLFPPPGFSLQWYVKLFTLPSSFWLSRIRFSLRWGA